MKKIMFILLFFCISISLLGEEIFFSILQKGSYEDFTRISTRVDDYNIKDSNGNFPVIVLLKGYIDYKESRKGDTPLHEAVRTNNGYLVRLLIEKGAVTSTWNSEGFSPEELAVVSGNLESAQILKTAPYRIYKQEKEYLDILSELVARHSNVNAFDQFGNSALLLAVKTGSLSAVKSVVEGGADLSLSYSSSDRDPLLYAIRMGRTSIASYLLEKGFNPNRYYKKEESGQSTGESPPVQPVIDYIIPSEYNFKLTIQSETGNPDTDRRCFYKVYIDKQEVGRTTTGLESQQKEYTGNIDNNRHLLSVVKYVLDDKQEKYVKLNNIEQPRPGFYYFSTTEGRITEVRLLHVHEGTSIYYSDFMRN
jgi:hypothetical protein